MLARFGASLAEARRYGCLALVTAGLLLPAPAPVEAAVPGTSIVNTASLSAANVALTRAAVSVRVSANLSFWRYTPSGSAPLTPLAPVSCGGAFLSQPAFTGSATGNLPALPASYPLAVATEYRVGEPVFFLVEDASRNLDALSRELLTVTISNAALGDSETLVISETGPDTGVFAGYIDTTMDVAATDCRLSVREGDTISATYGTEAGADIPLVDPFGLVFDSVTGSRLDNVRVQIIDVSTGAPAVVVGDAGEPYPDTVITGSTFSTGSMTYTLRPGEYRFPFVTAGRDYHLVVDQLPPGYVVPTARADADFASVPDGPYVVGVGSRGDPFPVPFGPPVRVDVPADAAGSGLFTVKTAVRDHVAIGDFVPYEVVVTNVLASAFSGVELRDVLPPGFRYRKGTLKIDGVKQPDPVIGSNGRDLQLALGTLAGNAAVRIAYITEVSAATPVGRAINRARATSGSVVSNEALATVDVREELMRSRSLLMGRVFETGSCAPEDIARGKPVPGARLYLEDGRYVLTDTRGRWHFDNIRPGTHVVQLDENGLPAGAEILACERHTRSAGNARSQFVDVQGGTLWQVDFYIKRPLSLHYRTEEKRGKVSVQLTSRAVDGGLRFTLSIKNPDAVFENGRLALEVPGSLEKVPGSFRINDVVQPEPASEVLLPALPAGEHRISWDMKLAEGARAGKASVRAKVQADIAGQSLVVEAVENLAQVVVPEKVSKVVVFRPRFPSFSTELAAADRRWLDDIVKDLRNSGEIRLEVSGHTDDVPVVPRAGRAINDNHALSLARAQSVADYLAQKLGLGAERIQAFGKGPDEPLSAEKTAAARASNRRVELKVFASGSEQAAQLELKAGDSGVRTVSWSQWQVNPVAEKEVREQDAEPPVPAVPVDEATGILSLHDGDVLASRIQAIRVRVDSRLRAELFLDGNPIEKDRLGFTKNEGKTTLMSFVGVDMGEPGLHKLTLKGTDGFGNERLNQTVQFNVAAEVTRLRPGIQVENVADGRTPVVLRIELLDGAGRVVPVAVDLRLVSGELRPLREGDAQRSLASSDGKLKVGADGTLKFAPVTRSGLYMMEIGYGNSVEKFPVYVRPEKREWILVALAEGSLAAKNISGNMQSASAAAADDSAWQDSRVALFAKGQIKGEWLLTLAYDSNRERAASFGGAINPEQFYTLYADATDPRFDAPSKEKLYLRIEKDAFYALFGDFDTGLTEVDLGRYSRSMTGIKSEYHDQRFDVNVFAADSSQGFVRDELRGDGTSGLYRLRARNILSGSDKLRIEVRDRLDSTVIVSSQTLSRWADYNIDYAGGTLFFKAPVPVNDSDLNPVWIVAEYEVPLGGSEALNAGGRVAVKFDGGRKTVGLTAVEEKAGINSGSLAAVDASWRVTASNLLKLELASSESDSALGASSGDAALLEWKHDSKLIKSRVYFREQEAGFGLGQVSVNDEGNRHIGAEGRYQLRQHLSLAANITQQEQLLSGNERLLADFKAEFTRDVLGYSVGLRHVAETLGVPGQPDRSADQLTLGGRYTLMRNRLKLRANAELGLAATSESDEFPDRLLLGADYQLSNKVQLSLEEEWAWSQSLVTQTTRAGVTVQPWKGAQIGTTLNHETGESGSRLRAGLGLGQSISLTPEWVLDVGYDRADTLKDNNQPAFNPAVPPAIGPASDDFWVASSGAIYQFEDIKATARIERREADTEDRWNLVGGIYRELNAELAIAAGITAALAERSGGDIENNFILRGSLAWRPDDVRWILLNRTDLALDKLRQSGSTLAGRRLVNNLNASRRWAHDQLSLQYGAKFVFDTIDGERVEGYTDLIGVEWRRDLSERWDVGAQTSLLHSWEPGVMDYSWGLSVGVTPMKNAWVSLGYNFKGFTDADFSAAQYTSEGFYLKMRLKVDQDSLRELWNNRHGVFR